jgi:hypothetical protein
LTSTHHGNRRRFTVYVVRYSSFVIVYEAPVLGRFSYLLQLEHIITACPRSVTPEGTRTVETYTALAREASFFGPRKGKERPCAAGRETTISFAAVSPIFLTCTDTYRTSR